VDMFHIQALPALFDGPEDWAWPIDQGAYSTIGLKVCTLSKKHTKIYTPA